MKKFENEPGIDEILDRSTAEQTEGYDEIGLLLSGGVDSISTGISAMRVGKKIHAYSFCLKDRPTYDSDQAEAVAKTFGWKFTKVEVPYEDNLVSDMKKLISDHGAIKKTHIECGLPMLYLIPEISQEITLCGLGVDGLFGMTKKCCIHFKEPKEKFDEYRSEAFRLWLSPKSSTRLIVEMFHSNGKVLKLPYKDDRVYEWFMRRDWYELNQPVQKQVIRNAYAKEFSLIPTKVKNHLNYQLVAGIDKEFEKQFLNNKEINFNDRKAMQFVYLDWVKKLTENNIEKFLV